MHKDKGIEGTRGDRKVIATLQSDFQKTEVAIFAYFSKVNNIPATYRTIARRYGRSNYPTYQKACKSLEKKGYLEKVENGKYRIKEDKWEMVKIGKEVFYVSIPYFEAYLKEL